MCESLRLGREQKVKETKTGNVAGWRPRPTGIGGADELLYARTYFVGQTAVRLHSQRNREQIQK